MRRRFHARVLRIAAIGVVALHAFLLWRRIADLSITEPLVLARWCVAAVAAAAALALLQRRASWRAWVVFWTVIVLLHAVAPAPMGILQTALVLLGCGVALASPRQRSSILPDRGISWHATLPVPSLATRAPPSF